MNGKIFAQLSAPAENEQRALVKLPAADQTALLMAAPDTFSSVPHWGRHGWTHVRLDGIEASALHDLLLLSWQQVAPKKAVAAHAAGKNPSLG